MQDAHPKIPIFLGQGLECTAVSTSATIATAVAVPFAHVEVVDFWVTLRGSSTHSTAPTFELSVRPTAGSTTRTLMATIAKPNLTAQNGKMLWATTLHTTHMTATAGGEFALSVLVSSGDSCLYDAGMVIREIPEVPANNTRMTGT